MSIFNKLSSIFVRKQDIPEVTLDTYANLPIFLMIQEDAPFCEWKTPDTKIPTQLEDTFKYSVQMYQMYIFFMLTAKRFGYEIASKVVKIQANRLSKASAELGQQLEIAIEQIHRSVLRNVEEPLTVEANEEKIEMPLEYCLALEFLTIGEDAPFYVDGDRLKAGYFPDLQEADYALAECLEHGKNAAMSYFEPITNIAKVVL